MLSVIMLIMANNSFRLSVVILNVIMLNVIMLNVIMLNVIMLNVIMLTVIMLNVVMLNAILLSVVAPLLAQYRGINLCLFIVKTISPKMGKLLQ